MKRFTPSMCHEPSGCGMARVRPAPTSDPASGSVSTMVEPHCFSTKSLANLFCSSVPSSLGGTLAPRALWWSLAEQILGANAPIWMYSSGPSFAHVVHTEGTAEQKEWAKLFVEKQWGSTMVLTEPDAGSDVGAGRTKAVEQPDGTWHIEGVKRFITSGEQDMTENIFHLVLARPEGAGPGTKGLSLFMVPKYEFDPETGELGARNGVYATNGTSTV